MSIAKGTYAPPPLALLTLPEVGALAGAWKISSSSDLLGAPSAVERREEEAVPGFTAKVRGRPADCARGGGRPMVLGFSLLLALASASTVFNAVQVLKELPFCTAALSLRRDPLTRSVVHGPMWKSGREHPLVPHGRAMMRAIRMAAATPGGAPSSACSQKSRARRGRDASFAVCDTV